MLLALQGCRICKESSLCSKLHVGAADMRCRQQLCLSPCQMPATRSISSCGGVGWQDAVPQLVPWAAVQGHEHRQSRLGRRWPSQHTSQLRPAPACTFQLTAGRARAEHGLQLSLYRQCASSAFTVLGMGSGKSAERGGPDSMASV